MKAAGIYVHLPYCRSRCSYCSFVVSTDDSSRSSYLSALEREADLLAPEASGIFFDSVYLGGGTPSAVPAGDLARLLEALRKRFDVLSGAEVTLEANPEDVTAERRDAWVSSGVNRVSVGVQSLEDRELLSVGRRHNAAEALRALETLTGKGLTVSADLILGLPGQTAASFRRSLEGISLAGLDHISVYILETDKSREIEEDRRSHPERYLSDDAQAELWLEMGEAFEQSGFLHYEISNWARPGCRCQHNLKYWQRESTLGLGVSSHEFWSGRRRANVSSLAQYLSRLERNERPLALDCPVQGEEERRERIILGLRLSDGVPSRELEDWIAERCEERLGRDYALWREEGILEEREGRVSFTERGFLLSNEVLCRLV